MFYTTNREILDTKRLLSNYDQSLWGQLMFGTKLRNAHSVLDTRCLGIQDKEKQLLKDFFVFENDEMQYDEIPVPEEQKNNKDAKPTKMPRLQLEKTLEEYNKKLNELLDTRIIIE